MEIEVRRTFSRYQNVQITEGSTTIDLGLMDEQEGANLAEALRAAAEELDPQSDKIETQIAALQSIVDDYEFCKNHPTEWGDRSEQYAITARDAIAAATGA